MFQQFLDTNLLKIAKPPSKKQLGTKLRTSEQFLTTSHVLAGLVSSLSTEESDYTKTEKITPTAKIVKYTPRIQLR